MKKSCGCTVARLSAADNRIAAGGTVEVAVTVALDGKPGTKTVLVTLESNDARQPVQTLEMTGQVTAAERPVEALPK